MTEQRSPPRYVPTLTEVVQPGGAPAADDVAPAAAVIPEELVHRVLQRIDSTLERRLRDAIAAVVMEQAQSLVPMLRAEVEAAVRQAVADAFEQELGRSSSQA